MTRFIKHRVRRARASTAASGTLSSARLRRAKEAATQDSNGLVGAAIHDSQSAKKVGTAFRALRSARTAGAAPNPSPISQLQPEAAARTYLERAFASRDVPQFVRPTISAKKNGPVTESEFKSLGAEAIPLAGTTAVKFRQLFNQIPVYGSLVTVELDRQNECVGINSSLGTPKGAASIAKISAAQALSIAAKQSGQPAKALRNTPRLNYYFHTDHQWHLVFIVEDVPQRSSKGKHVTPGDALKKDFVIDATTGRLLASLPRTPTLAALKIKAKDGLHRSRIITVQRLTGTRRALRDEKLNIATYDFGFHDPSAEERRLPGALVNMPPSPIPVEAVAAHANAEVVATFLRDVLKRNNIDDRGGKMLSSVNCWDRTDGTDNPREWPNAFWNGDQMVYGQILFPDGSFFSIANMTDVVGHEMFHGVTDSTSRLEYQAQSGALNESYSDIFGVIIANHGRPLSRWVWRIGEGFDGPNSALRDMQDPTRFDQPKHMRDYLKATPPYTYERNDYGHVHDNSGIHNFAAYRVMTAKTGSKYLFRASDIAAMFYLALTMHLSRTSQFADSRRAVLQAARSLFRKDAQALLNKKIKAIEVAFSAAGIV